MFLNCINPNEHKVANELLKACDVKKLDLSVNGPFGEQGPIYKEIIYKLDPNAGEKKKVDLKEINPYYLQGERLVVPGDNLEEPKKDPRFR